MRHEIIRYEIKKGSGISKAFFLIYRLIRFTDYQIKLILESFNLIILNESLS